MTSDQPWLQANLLLIHATGLNLIANRDEALTLAARADPGTEPRFEQPGRNVLRHGDDGEPRRMPNLQECYLSGPETHIDTNDTGVHLTIQLHDSGQLGMELRRAAVTFTSAVQVTANPGTLGSLRLTIAMNADRPPPGHPPQAEDPVANTYQTDNGLAFQHTLFWEPCKFEDPDDGEAFTSYDLSATALLGEPEIPGPNDLADVIIATYSAAAAFFLN